MVNRAKTRTLVRWSDDHDKELLLWLQYCCNEQGIKIPFPRVAQCMGPSFTEGAIVQHLAKIRTKMEDAGLHVPPAQKRGTVTRAASSIYKPKIKNTAAPVPRLRPDITPRSRGTDVIDDEEEEEEIGQKSDVSVQPKPRRIVRRQSSTRKVLSSVKQESDEDDPFTALEDELYDSDNEYGAKKQRTRKKRFSSGNVKEANTGRLNLNTRQPTLASYGYNQLRLPVGAGFKISDGSEGRASSRVIRRKSTALNTEDNNSDSSDPKSSAKCSGNSKKQKVSHDNDETTYDNEDMTTGGSFQGVMNNSTDRTAMPPPALPHATGDYGYTWDNEFMQGPFHSLSLADTSNEFAGVNSGTFTHALPADVTTFNMDFGSGVHNLGTDVPAYSSHEYFNGFPAPIMSNASTRNNSFASTCTDSTVESQPTSWAQPLRSPGFPNPHEATHILHQAINTTNADESNFINIFNIRGPSNEGDRVLGQNDFHGVFDNDGGYASASTNFEPSGLFVGIPDEPGDEIDYSTLLNTEELTDELDG